MADAVEAVAVKTRGARGVLLRRPVVGWALCDWANSAFATTVMAGFFPLYFKQYWNAGVEATESTFRLGLANGFASILVALMAPLIGAIADKGGARIRLLALFTVLGAAMTAALYWVSQGDWVTAAIFYVAASLGFWGGNQFYDSLITDVAEERDYDLVSGYGYALGYLGGGVLFLVNVLMVTQPALFGIADASEGVRLSFVTVGVWWVLFTLPVLFWVKERRDSALPMSAAIRAGWRELLGTMRYLRTDRTLLWFLLAYWFYIDGVNTIIKMAVDYGLSLGLQQASLITALLLVQFVGFPAALAFGWLGKRIGARTGIYIAIAVYTATAGYAYFLDTEREFFALAVVIGLVQGGVQSLSRSLYGRLIPEGKAGEFFGFYNLMGKAAAILGPILTGVVALTTGDSRLAIVSISILFVLGALFLTRVRVEGRHQAAGSSP
ncbi:MAG: MFS transporter [Steroidobacteraceae bacterium]|jgi:UMF1 family MFS transporter|nr:MFS transporter [Steroidobacteraceae bacterium]